MCSQRRSTSLVNKGASWPSLIEAGSRVLAMQTKLHQWANAIGMSTWRADAARVARPVRRAGRRNPSFERREGVPVRPYTYVRTWTGFLYLAVVLDAWSRRVVGWSMASHLRTELVLDALNMAIWQRRPRGVVHHSDQGSQYTSIAFGARCREAGVRPSTGSVGDAYDHCGASS